MEDDERQQESCKGGKDVAPALLALHPLSSFVVVAVGSQIRIFNLPEKCPVASKPQSGHKDAIRAISFSREGRLFVSSGDDKLVKLWDVESWQCIKTVHASKKVSAVSYSHDGEWLLYADKFGVVYAVSTKIHEDEPASLNQPVQTLAHCCSIITSLVIGKGMGDASLDTFTITCLSVALDGSLIAVGVESLNGVLFLKCDPKLKRLEFLQKLVLDEHFCPTSIQFDGNGWLWLVAGATTSCEQNAVTWVKVVSTSSNSIFVTKTVDVECLPGGTLLLETLDGTDSDVKKATALADAAKIAVKNQLSKRQYTPEHRELRKRLRNDKKLQSEA